MSIEHRDIPRFERRRFIVYSSCFTASEGARLASDILRNHKTPNQEIGYVLSYIAARLAVLGGISQILLYSGGEFESPKKTLDPTDNS